VLVSAYFPLFDSRDFFPERRWKTQRPEWPSSNPAIASFQRNLGRIAPRPLGGVRGWASVCEVRRSIKVKTSVDQAVALRPVFVRFLSDGWGGAQLSIGLRVTAERPVSDSELFQALWKTQVCSRHSDQEFALSETGELTAILYANGTSKRGAPAQNAAMLGRTRPLSTPTKTRVTDITYTQVPIRGGGERAPVFWLPSIQNDRYNQSTRATRIILARLYLELFSFEQCLSLLRGPATASMDGDGLNSIRRRLDTAAIRLTGRRRPSMITAPSDYARLMEIFSDQHGRGRPDALLHALEALDANPNLRGAIRRTAAPIGTAATRMYSVTYNNYGNAGAIGENASATNFGQSIRTALDDVDMRRLADELAGVESAVSSGDQPGGEAGALALAEARLAASANDKPGVLVALGKVGPWALNAATSVGAGLAVQVIKATLNL
jgi:hypothetical protein